MASYFTRFLLLVSWENCSFWYFVVYSIFSCFSWFVIDRTDTKWNKSKIPCTLISLIISEWLSKQTNNAWSVFITFLNNIVYCSYKEQNILKLRAKVYQFELILILFKSRKLPLYVFASPEKHFFPLCTLLPSIASFLPGGSPYPDINARKIAQKLQEGYRMPKPRHVEIKLWVIIRVGKRKF